MKNKRLLRLVVILSVFFVQFFVLISMFEETGRDGLFIPVVLLLILALLIGGYQLKSLHHTQLVFERIGVVVWIPIAALITYWLNNSIGWGPVLSLGVVGTIGSYVFLFNRRSNYLKEIPPPIYCGAFIGMSSLDVQDVYVMIALAGLFTAVIYVLTRSLLVGIGGKLGTLAFIGFLLSMFLIHWILR